MPQLGLEPSGYCWCEQRDLNPHGCPPEPKSGASANFAILALYWCLGMGLNHRRRTLQDRALPLSYLSIEFPSITWASYPIIYSAPASSEAQLLLCFVCILRRDIDLLEEHTVVTTILARVTGPMSVRCVHLISLLRDLLFFQQCQRTNVSQHSLYSQYS